MNVKQVVVTVLAGLILLAGCSSTPAPRESSVSTFTNPVYAGTKDRLPESADPAALKFNGEYYVYVTGDPCLVLKSEDLVHWQLVGQMLAEKVSCWAPSVVYKNGTFYAYASTTERDMGEGSRRVRLYTSNSPAGPFALKATVTEAYYSYDGEYFMDDDGQEYLFWTQDCGVLPDDCSGNGTVVDKLIGMEKLAGSVRLVGKPEGWECRHRCILEAPALLKRDGRYYAQYSGAAYENDSYGGGYLYANAPLGPWTKADQLLKSMEAKVDGPGGADWVKAPNNLDDWAIYHGRGITRETWDRWLRIDPVMWGRDRLWLPGAPSFAAQAAPAMPAFRDLFGGTSLGNAWKTTGGTWAVTDGHLRQTGGGTARALVTQAAAAEYAAEVSLRLLPGTGGAAGLVLDYAGEKADITVMIDRAENALIVRAGEAGQGVFHLRSDFNYEVFHHLLVVKNGGHLTFIMDEAPYGGFGAPITGTGRIGLATVGTGAEFDGVAMTHGWEDFFDLDAVLWGDAEDGTKRTGEWGVQKSALIGSAAGDGGGGAQAFRGTRQWRSYEFTVSFQAGDPDARPGLYAAYYDAKNYVRVTIDPLAKRLTTTAVINGQPGQPETTGVKLESSGYHTVQVIKHGTAFAIYFDGQLVQQRTISLPQGQPGLYVETGRVEFDSIRAIRRD